MLQRDAVRKLKYHPESNVRDTGILFLLRRPRHFIVLIDFLTSGCFNVKLLQETRGSSANRTAAFH
jgi:hypothetical protein